MNNLRFKYLVLSLVTVVTLLLHFYGILWVGLLGHSAFLHVIHGRLCYIPIVLGAVWFGLRGGVMTAVVITIFSYLYIVLKPVVESRDLINEYTEIVFYFAIAVLAGIILDRERAVRKKKEKAEQQLQMAERLSMMGQMAASIAHEIKNPLASIRGAAQILQDEATPEADKLEFSAIIEKEADRLDGVVRDFLAYSRPSPARISDVDITGLLQAAWKQLGIQAQKQGVEIILDLEQVPSIKGDVDKLHQVFLNVILNAVQAAPDGGRVELRCRLVRDGRNRQVEVVIADNGPGISPRDFARIFDPFFSTKSQGTGLGLATARAIIEEHKGRIHVESTEGEGTSFFITLPLNDGES